MGCKPVKNAIGGVPATNNLPKGTCRVFTTIDGVRIVDKYGNFSSTVRDSVHECDIPRGYCPGTGTPRLTTRPQ